MNWLQSTACAHDCVCTRVLCVWGGGGRGAEWCVMEDFCSPGFSFFVLPLISVTVPPMLLQ